MAKKEISPLPRWELRNCVDVDPEIFFIDEDNADTPSGLASSYCTRCEIISECLTWASDNDQRGVWGNTTYKQRLALKKTVFRVTCIGCRGPDILEMPDNSEICLDCGLSWKL